MATFPKVPDNMKKVAYGQQCGAAASGESTQLFPAVPAESAEMSQLRGACETQLNTCRSALERTQMTTLGRGPSVDSGIPRTPAGFATWGDSRLQSRESTIRSQPYDGSRPRSTTYRGGDLERVRDEVDRLREDLTRYRRVDAPRPPPLGTKRSQTDEEMTRWRGTKWSETD